MWNQIDGLREQLAEADRRIRELEKENDTLRAQYQALHRGQFKKKRRKQESPTNKGQPSSQDGADSSGAQERKKRGAPKGHPGWRRCEPNHIDRTVEVSAPQVCPHCACAHLTAIDDIKEHVQEDIVLEPKTFVTKYLHRQAFCEHCRRPVIQAGPEELLNSPIGPVAKSAAIYLRYAMGLSYRKVRHLLGDFFGLQFAPATALGWDRQAAAKGEPLYDDLREKIRASSVVHADETSWRQDGDHHFVWFVGNPDLAVFHIDKHRSTDVAQSLLGTRFDGVLVADAYAAYNGVNPTARQSCLAHIIRRAKDIAQELLLLNKRSRDSKAESFCSKIATFFSNACDIAQQLAAGLLDRKQAPSIEQKLTAELDQICATELTFRKAETLRIRLIDTERDRLFTFLRYPDVPPTNNHAEQSIRFFVIFRKLIFGTRSALGSRTHSILASLVATALRQGIAPRQFLQTLLVADTPTAQAALYDDSS